MKLHAETASCAKAWEICKCEFLVNNRSDASDVIKNIHVCKIITLKEGNLLSLP